MKNKNDKWFLSATGSNDLALTIKGMLLGYIPAILIVAQSLNITLTETEVSNWILVITTLISAVMLIAGISRKMAIYLKKGLK